jgi:hypothetical protein
MRWRYMFALAAAVSDCAVSAEPLFANPNAPPAVVDASAPQRVLVGVKLAERHPSEGELDALRAALQRQSMLPIDSQQVERNR